MHRPAPRPIRADARGCLRTGCDRSQLSWIGRADLLQATLDDLSPAALRPELRPGVTGQRRREFPIPCLLESRPRFIFLHAITGDCRRGCGLRFAKWLACLGLDDDSCRGIRIPTTRSLAVDYRDYGKCQGHATIANMRASGDAALDMLANSSVFPGRLDPRLCTIGHSLGSAVALDFAARHRIQRVVAISPFTTLREEAACIIGGPLSHLLIESCDNRSSITEIRKRNRRRKLRSFTARTIR